MSYYTYSLDISHIDTYQDLSHLTMTLNIATLTLEFDLLLKRLKPGIYIMSFYTYSLDISHMDTSNQDLSHLTMTLTLAFGLLLKTLTWPMFHFTFTYTALIFHT